MHLYVHNPPYKIVRSLLRFVFISCLPVVVTARIEAKEQIINESKIWSEGGSLSITGGLFESKDDNFIEAVGFPHLPVKVHANKISYALLRNADVRLCNVEIDGYLSAARDTKSKIYFFDVTFNDPVHFTGLTLANEIKIKRSRFKKVLSFGAVTFKGISEFRGNSFLNDLTFRNVIFDRLVIFEKNKLFEKTDIVLSNLKNGGSIIGLKSYGPVSFEDSIFEGTTVFKNSQFLNRVNFQNTKFLKPTTFDDIIFEGYTQFTKTDFYNDISFSNIRFRDIVDLRSYFPEEAHHNIKFSGITEINGMIEWNRDKENDILYLTQNTQLSKSNLTTNSAERRGLNNALLNYNKSFYLALIENFEKQGRFAWADDVYFDYRKQERMRQHWWLRFWGWLFQELPYGYGVRYWRFLVTFIFIWFCFAIHYQRRVRYVTKSSKVQAGQRKINRIYGRKIALLSKFHTLYLRSLAWAALHSLNNMTPGIDLHSIEDKWLRNNNRESKLIIFKREWPIWGQRIQQVIGWYLLALFLLMFGRIWMR